MTSSFAALEKSIDHLAGGGIAIVVDRERENEGDFISIAELISPETIHFMTAQGRGHLCMPIHPTIADRLNLEPLVPANGLDAPRFTMPLDHQDCETGISPNDRALTVRQIVNPCSRPQDFCRPGHIFPLMGQPRGLEQRQGHTEAAIDLCIFSGKQPAAVICEICSRDGQNMAGPQELDELAAEFSLPIIAIDQLIEYRKRNLDVWETLALTLDLKESIDSTVRSTPDFDSRKQPIK